MKIGIVTAFSSMLDFYSLTTVILNQIRMILAAGHIPYLIVQEDFNWSEKGVPNEFAHSNLVIRSVIPNYHKIDYTSIDDLSEEHEKLVPVIIAALRHEITDLKLDAIFTHDLIFTGWNMPVGLAIQELARTTGPWYHWIHSVPGGRRDYWRLPDNSMLVYPNNTDRVRVAEEYQTWPEKVLVVPHCADLRDFGMTSDLAKDLITRFDVFGADIVQVYPIPTDRLTAKGIPWVVKMFGILKDYGFKVRLIVPNAWCNVNHLQREVEAMMLLGEQAGLTEKELIFTSRVYPEQAVGLPHTDIRDIMLAGNLFICPTISETFGLSLAEAAMMGSFLVLNDDLPMMKEIVGNYRNAIWAKFSSNFFKTKIDDEPRYLRDICKIVIHQIQHSPSFQSTNHYRKAYRREAVWQILDAAITSFRSGAEAPRNA